MLAVALAAVTLAGVRAVGDEFPVVMFFGLVLVVYIAVFAFYFYILYLLITVSLRGWRAWGTRRPAAEARTDAPGDRSLPDGRS